MARSVQSLVNNLSAAEKQAAKSCAPEGYEEDYQRAYAILAYADDGGDINDLAPPEGWRERFVALSYHTELPPALCARLCGVTLAYIRMYLSQFTDQSLEKAIMIGRISNFESRIDHPRQRDLRAAAIPLAGINSLAGWDKAKRSEKAAVDLEVDRAIEARKRLHETIELTQEIEEKQVEEMRNARPDELNGVLGLGSDDISIDEEC